MSYNIVSVNTIWHIILLVNTYLKKFHKIYKGTNGNPAVHMLDYEKDSCWILTEGKEKFFESVFVILCDRAVNLCIVRTFFL